MAKSESISTSACQRDQPMNLQEPTEIECPYCGERVSLLIDCSVASQEYIEDCQVCCQPINLQVTINEQGIPQVEARRDDE